MLEYNSADEHLHQLSQIIAKANRSFVPYQGDDSHTNLYFDKLGDRLLGRWIKTDNEYILLSLSLTKLEFVLLNNVFEHVQTVSAVGKTSSEIEDELEIAILKNGLEPSNFSEKLHFEITAYEFANSPFKKISSIAMNKWRTYRGLANSTCNIVLDYLQIPSEPRIWPHHFDTGIYVPITTQMGLGFGLAMKDSITNSPYFYMAGYPDNQPLDYNDLPDLNYGRWELSESWSGAILSLTEIEKMKNESKTVVMSEFLLNTLSWYLKQ